MSVISEDPATRLSSARIGQRNSFWLIGALLVKAGKLSHEDVQAVLRCQKQAPRRFGEAAINLGLLSHADVQDALALQFNFPVLGVRAASLSQELIVVHQPASPEAEALRSLRAQLMFRWPALKSKQAALAVISGQHGDGRSVLAANLSVVFSQMNLSTLLVDADMRRPRLHDLFAQSNLCGLSTILARRSWLDTIDEIPRLGNLSVLPAGPVPPNPQELLGSGAFRDFVRFAAVKYDAVIFDTPASDAYADSGIVTATAGAALVLAVKNKTRVESMKRLIEQVLLADAIALGAVLRDV
jgi:receptor protein-tyrosine kinase